MKAIELSPSGTTVIEEKPAVLSKPGVHIIREPKDLYPWTGIQIDESEAVEDVATLPKAESTILFAILRDPTLRVISPIPVEITRDGDTVVASWAEADEYGYGRNRSEALEDFGQTISQLFRTLSADEQKLGSDMLRVLALFRSHIRFRSR